MKILIADDERPARTRLRHLLEQSDSDVHIIGEAENGDQVLEISEMFQPDIVLLDIRMPGKNGLEICKLLSAFSIPPAVILVTAFDEHALQAFDAHAVDYVLKPVHQQRLDAALRKAIIFQTARKLETSQQSTDHIQRTHISVKDRSTLYRIPVSDIIYFKAEQKYVVIRTDKLELLSSESLKNLEKEFGGSFMRVHRNALVSLNAISSLEKHSNGKFYIHFNSVDDEIEISRRHRLAARNWLKMNGNQGAA
ncbi:MAG TPA: response regulator transcription factor [Crenotrichaceae bacterium]|nr:response regulator transcription factor [Crenotrichaceae bacterium]